MRLRLCLAVAVGLVSGCLDGGGDVTCDAPAGLYRITSRQQSGDCPGLPDQVVNFDTPAEDGCKGTRDVSASRCVISSDRTCGPDADGFTVIYRSKVTWYQDASSAHGTMYTEARDKGSLVCTAVYGTTYTKL